MSRDVLAGGTANPGTLEEFFSFAAARVNAFLKSRADELSAAAPELREAMRHGLLLGGKRARPFLVYAAGRLTGAADASLDYAAAAVECVHAFSLIHDDMPEMDNDFLRRGQPTVHAKFGQATALLAGDALQALGFDILSDSRAPLTDRQRAVLCAELSQATGYEGMCGGQALDLAAEGQRLSLDALRGLHARKTGALIKASVRMGAALGKNAGQQCRDALDRYADYTGLAFQVWDDVLNVTGDEARLGKSVGSDEKRHKNTYPALMGLQEARDFASECVSRACTALSEIGAQDSMLAAFAQFTVTRDH